MSLYNIELCDFNKLFNDSIFIETLNAWHSYNLISENTVNLKLKDVRSFLTYFVIYFCVKYLKGSTDSNKRVIVIQPSIVIPREDSVVYNAKSLTTVVKIALKTLSKSYPNNVVFLKRESILTNPDVVDYVFNKANSFTKINNKELLTTIKTNEYKL